jgi:hypothetical protein
VLWDVMGILSATSCYGVKNCVSNWSHGGLFADRVTAWSHDHTERWYHWQEQKYGIHGNTGCRIVILSGFMGPPDWSIVLWRDLVGAVSREPRNTAVVWVTRTSLSCYLGSIVTASLQRTERVEYGQCRTLLGLQITEDDYRSRVPVKFIVRQDLLWHGYSSGT